MQPADREHRALRRELLLVRASAERVALASQLGALRQRSSAGLPGLLLGGVSGARRVGSLRLIASALRFARSQPWLVPAVASAARSMRSRTVRWVALVAIAAIGLWWYRAVRGARAHEAPVAEPSQQAADAALDAAPIARDSG